MASPTLTAIAVIVVVAVAAVAVFSFYPNPNRFNVNVEVTSEEVALLVTTYFSISSVTGQTSGHSPYLDWVAWYQSGSLAPLGFAPPAINAEYKMTVCLTPGSYCASLGATQWFPSVPVINGGQVQATNHFTIGNVPSGTYTISATLFQTGSSVASGSGSVTVG